MIFPNELTQKEIRQGLIYQIFSLALLPLLLGLLPLRSGLQNMIYYALNFAATVLIFHRFLHRSLLTALDRLFPTLYYGALAFLGYQTLSELLSGMLAVFPEFANVNDLNVKLMLLQDPYPIAIAIIVLVPVAEECFYRGVLFRGLYDRSPVLAYILSMAAFAAIHVVGYIESHDLLQLLLCFIQYLPAGYCLCFAYRRSGTILSPILVHSIVNALGVYNTMR